MPVQHEFRSKLLQLDLGHHLQAVVRIPYLSGFGLRLAFAKPLSPLLFIIALEMLSNLFHHACERQELLGLSESTKQNLFFADNILICFRLSDCYCNKVKEILLKFCKASGQQINEHKRKIILNHKHRLSDNERVLIDSLFNFEI